MASTKAEVRDIAATELGLLRLGQSLQNQDRVELDRRYDEVHADLKEMGLATWASTASVPTALVPHVVALIALSAAQVYGISGERYQRIAAMAAMAKPSIARLVTPRYESTEEAVDY